MSTNIKVLLKKIRIVHYQQIKKDLKRDMKSSFSINEQASNIKVEIDRVMKVKLPIKTRKSGNNIVIEYILKADEIYMHEKIKISYEIDKEKLIKLGTIPRISNLSTLSNIKITANTLFHSSLPPIKNLFLPKGTHQEFTFTPKNLHNNDTKLRGDVFNNPVSVEIGKKIIYEFKQVYEVKPPSELTNFKLKLRILRNTHFQKVKHKFNPSNCVVTEDDEGNLFANWKIDKIKKITYFEVETQIKRTPEIFYEKEYGNTTLYLGSNKKYIKKTEQWDLDAEKTKNLIKYSKKRNVFSIVVETFEFVNNYIKYKITSGRVPASKTLRKKTGDCTEFADLLVNLLRIKKIPARLSFGFVINTETHALDGHAWVEFMSPSRKWYSIDPTWGYLGGLDSSFILEGYDLGEEDDNIEKTASLSYSSFTNISSDMWTSYKRYLSKIK